MPEIITSVTVFSNEPEAVAAKLEDFARRIRLGEVGPGMEGDSTDTCSGCGESIHVSWYIEPEEDDEEGEEDDGDGGDEIPASFIDTPFGRFPVATFNLN